MAKPAKKEEAKQARMTFTGEGVSRVMYAAYPAIGKILSVPVGTLSTYTDDGYTTEALDNGWKQRFGDFRAVDGDQTDKAKDQEAFDRAEEYKEHLLDGGEWKMTAGSLTKTLIKALLEVEPKFTVEQLKAAAKHDPAQVKHWRKDARVQVLLNSWNLAKAQANLKDAKVEALVINLPK